MLEALLVRWTMPRQRSAIRGPSGSLGSEFRVIGMSPASQEVSRSQGQFMASILQQKMQGECGVFIYENQQMKQAESMACLDTWSDEASALDQRILQTLRAVEFDERLCNHMSRSQVRSCFISLVRVFPRGAKDVSTWGLYECHSGDNQKFVPQGSRFCTYVDLPGKPQCFLGHEA